MASSGGPEFVIRIPTTSEVSPRPGSKLPSLIWGILFFMGMWSLTIPLVTEAWITTSIWLPICATLLPAILLTILTWRGGVMWLLSFAGGCLIASVIGIAGFAVFGAVSYSLIECGGTLFFFPLMVQECFRFALDYGAAIAFPLGGVIGLLLRWSSLRTAEKQFHILFGAGLGTLGAILSTAWVRFGHFKTDRLALPDEIMIVRVEPGWILVATLLTGVVCGGLIAVLTSTKARSPQPARGQLSSRLLVLLSGMSLMLTLGVYLVLWESTPLFTRGWTF